MKVVTTVGQLLINHALPKEMRDYKRQMNKKSISSILTDVAKKHPTKYKDVLSGFNKVGQRAAYLKGSELGIDDFFSPIDHASIIDKESSKLSVQSSDKDVVSHFSQVQKKIEKQTMDQALKRRNSLAMQVNSGARGNASQLASTLSTPTLYADNAGRPIRVPIRHSFSEGLDPVEFVASTYGTRTGVIATKFATPKGGYFGKQIGYVAGNVVVTVDDCKTRNGIDTTPGDPENIGRFLARPAGRYPYNTKLTNEILSDLQKKRISKLIIRSPITCENVDGGVCKYCRGYTEQGVLPALGENVGINSAAAMSEAATQGAMNVKHTGGQVSSAQKGGFDLIQQLVKVPSVFQGGAVVSELDGKIDSIETAPQGGHNISVSGKKHYVLPQNDILVKPGVSIEAGQPLSTGIINPADVTRLRGIGEGRKFLFESLRKAYSDDGQKLNKIHTETLSKSMLNYMRVNEDRFMGDNIPGDVVTVQHVQKNYNPTGTTVKTEDGVGKYLTTQQLHLEAGVKLKPSMARFLKEHDIDKIDVTNEEPPFSPVMIRLDDVPAHKDNWLARLYSNQIKKKIIGATQQSESAPIHSLEYVPSYVLGKPFGKEKIKY